MHELTKHLEDTLDAVNHTIKDICKNAGSAPLSSHELDELDQCWRIIKNAGKTAYMGHKETNVHAVSSPATRM